MDEPENLPTMEEVADRLRPNRAERRSKDRRGVAPMIRRQQAADGALLRQVRARLRRRHGNPAARAQAFRSWVTLENAKRGYA